MRGRTCLVTGATSGIGRETAAALAARGARVLIVGRDASKTHLTATRLQAESGNPDVVPLIADLSSQEQIRRLSEQLREHVGRLDVLVNNVGAIFERRQLSADGIEMTLALNHLGYFLLTQLLGDLLESGTPARIVNVASDAHRRGRVAFDDLQRQHRYGAWSAYCQSKLANVLFTYELARRLSGSAITVNAVHPGFVASGFGSNGRGWLRATLRLAMRVAAISVSAGAQTPIYLATAPHVDDVSGAYFYKMRRVASSPSSYDAAAARRLWDMSLALVAIGDRWPAAGPPHDAAVRRTPGVAQ